MFNHSLLKGVFSPQLKNSFISPIHKSGNKNLIPNYRPITKLSTLPKLLEKLMMPWLTFSFKNILNSTQYSFMKGRSVETNRLIFYNTIPKSPESGSRTDVIYTDFSKAFDSVNHSILLNYVCIVFPILCYPGSIANSQIKLNKLGLKVFCQIPFLLFEAFLKVTTYLPYCLPSLLWILVLVSVILITYCSRMTSNCSLMFPQLMTVLLFKHF